MTVDRTICTTPGCDHRRRRTGERVDTGSPTYGRLCKACHADSMREYRERKAAKKAKRKGITGRALAASAALVGSSCSMLPSTQGEVSELSAVLGQVATDVGAIGMGMASGDPGMTSAGIAGIISAGLGILTGTGMLTAKHVNKQRDGRRVMRKEAV